MTRCACTALDAYGCDRPIPDREPGPLCAECQAPCRSWVMHAEYAVWHYADPPGTTITEEPQ